MSSNVPALQITSTGVSAPDAITIRDGILQDENIAFGGELDIVTPSIQMQQSLTLLIR